MGSDGSVHLHEQEAAAAWVITHSESEFATATFLLSEASITSLSSYRSELEGTFCALRQIEDLNMSPESVLHWCDNEQTVINSNKES